MSKKSIPYFYHFTDEQMEVEGMSLEAHSRKHRGFAVLQALEHETLVFCLATHLIWYFSMKSTTKRAFPEEEFQ